MLGIKLLFKFNLLIRITEPNPRDWISLKTICGLNTLKNKQTERKTPKTNKQKPCKKFILLNSKIISKKAKDSIVNINYSKLGMYQMCQCAENALLAQTSHILGKFAKNFTNYITVLLWLRMSSAIHQVNCHIILAATVSGVPTWAPSGDCSWPWNCPYCFWRINTLHGETVMNLGMNLPPKWPNLAQMEVFQHKGHFS